MRLHAAHRALLIAASEAGVLRAGDTCATCHAPLDGRLDNTRILSEGQVVHAGCVPRLPWLRACLTGRRR